MQRQKRERSTRRVEREGEGGGGRAGENGVEGICTFSNAFLEIHVRLLVGLGEKRILGEREANATLDRVGQTVALEFVHGLRRKHDIVELNEAHGTLWLGAEAHTLVSTADREELAQLVLASERRQITDIERVAGRVLVSRVVGARLSIDGGGGGRRRRAAGGRGAVVRRGQAGRTHVLGIASSSSRGNSAGRRRCSGTGRGRVGRGGWGGGVHGDGTHALGEHVGIKEGRGRAIHAVVELIVRDRRRLGEVVERVVVLQDGLVLVLMVVRVEARGGHGRRAARARIQTEGALRAHEWLGPVAACIKRLGPEAEKVVEPVRRRRRRRRERMLIEGIRLVIRRRQQITRERRKRVIMSWGWRMQTHFP